MKYQIKVVQQGSVWRVTVYNLDINPDDIVPPLFEAMARSWAGCHELVGRWFLEMGSKP
jgi:hypothetical protein